MVTCVARHADISFAVQIHDASTRLLEVYDCSYTIGRGLAVSALFMAHLRSPLRDNLELYYNAIDHSLISGDKHQMLLSVGGIAAIKLFCGEDLGEVDGYCSTAPEDFGDWTKDLRGGTTVIGCRQAARALQGKTWIDDPQNVMTDETHSTPDYLHFLSSQSSKAEWPRVIYGSYMLMVLFMYGHYDKATQVSNELIPQLNTLWSLRCTRLVYFYASLSIVARIRENPSLERQDDLLGIVEKYKAQIVEWQSYCDANYSMWSLLIEAEVCELRHEYHGAIQAYEAAIDHAQLFDFNLELALTLESQGEFFIRRGARRGAIATIKDSMAIYSRVGAAGKVNQIATKHEFLLSSFITVRTRDVGIQTESSVGDFGNTQFRIEENERQEIRELGEETASDRTKAWVSPMAYTGGEASETSLGLDILDLTSILRFSQAISSELEIDKLLVKMTQIILESAGSQAGFACVVIRGEDGWSVAASGSSDSISATVSFSISLQHDTNILTVSICERH